MANLTDMQFYKTKHYVYLDFMNYLEQL